ncbi:MAG: HD-GYP domain-containing protein, partial [Deltaproteobacteria bacterium]|nr:HD-GYP domain-containing protein [Deltaproteobacteria bacterium]
NGMLILNAIPNPEVEEKVKVFLSRYAKNVPGEKLDDLIKKTPLILSRNTNEKIGETFASKLQMLGASASYVPKTIPADAPFEDHGSAQAIDSDAVVEDLHTDHVETSSVKKRTQKHAWKKRLVEQLVEVNKELWVILSMIVIVGAMNYLLASQRMLLGLYTLPTLFSAYFYGRRHATFTAFASVLLVGIAIYYNPAWLTEAKNTSFMDAKWYELMAWGGILMITAYAMGTLYDRDKKKVLELREAYQGILVILRRFISNDQYTENHCYRVSVYAAKIAAYLGFNAERIEDIRSAALLHDIGKLEISRKLLHKAAHLTRKEYDDIKQHVQKSDEILQPVQGPLGRILPIILAHHEKYDGSGYNHTGGEKIPLEARVLSVADVYDSLTSDRPYRKAMSPFEAKDAIEKGSGKEFDPKVVKAFLKAFSRGEMEVPNVVL